jgi:hypothetical protein
MPPELDSRRDRTRSSCWRARRETSFPYEACGRRSTVIVLSGLRPRPPRLPPFLGFPRPACVARVDIEPEVKPDRSTANAAPQDVGRRRRGHTFLNAVTHFFSRCFACPSGGPFSLHHGHSFLDQIETISGPVRRFRETLSSSICSESTKMSWFLVTKVITNLENEIQR